jgi:hypothetical protein
MYKLTKDQFDTLCVFTEFVRSTPASAITEWQFKEKAKEIEQILIEIEAKKKEEEIICPAIVCHGPGHQSRTHCQAIGPHTVHHATFGEFDDYLGWTGNIVFF